MYLWPFQSTRPVWGATTPRSRRKTQRVNFNPRAPCGARLIGQLRALGYSVISIHAPRVGRDDDCPQTADGLPISIHAPRVGRDTTIRELDAYARISIHAPRVGRDPVLRGTRPISRYFNPRAPCGARRGAIMAYYNPYIFQSTRPVWGATCGYGRQTVRHVIFQSTRPVWGATSPFCGCGCGCGFQSTRPVWGATSGGREEERCIKISIHAPRVGRDQICS